MRAVVVNDLGMPATLVDVPVPDVQAGQVLVRVLAAGLNPFDNAIAAGMMTEMVEHDYPVVLGRDAAGIVEAVGEGVTGIAVGDAVVGHVLFAPPIKHGTLAEYAVLPAETVVPKPEALDFVTAAAIPLAGAAAVAAVEAVAPQPGEVVLVVGASGGVGSYAVQLATGRGATVIATGLPEDTDRLRGLGASFVVDYRDDLPTQVRTVHPGSVHALIDLVSRTPEALADHAALLEAGGRVASTIGAADIDVLAARKVTGTNIMATPVSEVVGPLLDQAANKSLTVDIGQLPTIAEALAGLQAVAAGQAKGKLVVRIAEDAEAAQR